MNFSKAMFSVKVSNEPCPDAQALSDWAAGQITAERRETLTQHTAVCSLCAERVAALIRFSESPPAEEAPPESLKKKVRQRIPEDVKAPAWRRLLFHPRLWLVLFLISLAGSFFVTRYYKQFLILALVCGGKWLLESRSSKTNITLISKGDSEEGNRWQFRRKAKDPDTGHTTER